MFLSVFDIFKIGIGPSSSHTMGPMVAAARFLSELREWAAESTETETPVRLQASLHGSLAFTGKGHATDRAVILGLLGFLPDTLDPDLAERLEGELRRAKGIVVDSIGPVGFDPETDLIFDYGDPLPGHANGLVLRALNAAGLVVFERTFYSIGGGVYPVFRRIGGIGTDGSEYAA